MASAELQTVLARVRQGERSALEELVTLLYPELRRRAAQYLRRERRGHTLQPTALMNEAYLRLFSGDELEWNDRAHFLAAILDINGIGCLPGPGC
jgi:RNA polymerase sigma-70 factor (ECF subfamily)